MLLKDRPPLSKVDKLSLIALAGVLITTVLFYELIDGAASRAAEVDKSAVTQEIAEQAPLIAQTLPVEAGPQTAILLPPEEVTGKDEAIPLCAALVEAVEAMKADRYDETIPLDRQCQKALWNACIDNNVPVCLALGLIEVESDFQPYAENGVSYGLCQLNRKYWPEGLTPDGNIQCGISYLGELLENYDGDEHSALRAYNKGWDDGDREYSRKVLAASEKWGNG